MTLSAKRGICPLAELVAQLPKALGGTPLGRAVAWLRHQREFGKHTNQGVAVRLVNSSTGTSELLPTHLPSASTILAASSFSWSRRVQQRRQRRRLAWALTEWLVGVCTFYSCGSPKTSSLLIKKVGRYQVSSRQCEYIRGLFQDVWKVCRRPLASAAEMGRGVATLEKLLDVADSPNPERAELDALAQVSHDVQLEHIITSALARRVRYMRSTPFSEGQGFVDLCQPGCPCCYSRAPTARRP